MKKRMLAISLIFGLTTLPLIATEGEGFSLGFGLSDAAGNLGISAELSSPNFAYDFLKVRIESQGDWLTNPVYAVNEDFAGDFFSTHRLGLVGQCGWCADAIRLYGEFGGLVCLPPEDITDDDIHVGIYGLFGFEFFITKPADSPVSLYMEAGTNNLFGTADSITGSPDYYSGFTARTGFRYYF